MSTKNGFDSPMLHFLLDKSQREDWKIIKEEEQKHIDLQHAQLRQQINVVKANTEMRINNLEFRLFSNQSHQSQRLQPPQRFHNFRQQQHHREFPAQPIFHSQGQSVPLSNRVQPRQQFNNFRQQQHHREFAAQPIFHSQGQSVPSQAAETMPHLRPNHPLQTVTFLALEEANRLFEQHPDFVAHQFPNCDFVDTFKQHWQLQKQCDGFIKVSDASKVYPVELTAKQLQQRRNENGTIYINLHTIQ